jgi:pilus assembly protein Flp/PilA
MLQINKKKLNSKGQGLVEYMVLIAFAGVASIVAMRYLNHTVNAKITSIVHTLQGKPSDVHFDKPTESVYKKKDLGDFLNGAASKDE